MRNLVRLAIWTGMGGAGLAAAQTERPAGGGLGWDRSRGTVEISPESAVYESGGHFGRWSWPEPISMRAGSYGAEVTYATNLARVGFQVAVGEQQAKGYAPGTGGMARRHVVRLSTVYLEQDGKYPLKVLSSVDVAEAEFELVGISLVPAPEGEKPVTREDGAIELPAAAATTLSEAMRYEPGEAHGSLTGWSKIDDWAEWTFDAKAGGIYTVEMVYHCDEGDGGSEVSLWVDDAEMSFTVADSDEGWTTASLGEVALEEGPARWLAVKPRSKADGEVFKLRAVILKPVTKESP